MYSDSFITSNLQDGADRQAQAVKDKVFSYVVLDRIFMPTERKGKCIVTNISYDLSDDCNWYNLKDIDTGKCFSINQFYINLKEIN